MPPRAVVITDATGRLGGAIIDALLSRFSEEFRILAVTEDPRSPASVALLAKSASIKLVEGSLEFPGKFLKQAHQIAQTAGEEESSCLWGLFAAPSSDIFKPAITNEPALGKDLVDEAINFGVKHFVYSSIDRGGDEQSWNNPTEVPLMKARHEVEVYIRDQAANSRLGWTILRPVHLMEDMSQGYASTIHLAALRDTLCERPLQWVSAKDVGFFVAEAFYDPKAWDKRAVGLAGDQLSFSQLNRVYEKVTHEPAPVSLSFTANLWSFGNPQYQALFDWYNTEGCGVNLVDVKEMNPNMINFERWLKGASTE